MSSLIRLFLTAKGLDPNKFDIEDFKIKDVEVKFSPRIGIGFPVTEQLFFMLSMEHFSRHLSSMICIPGR